jgi:hypothetical protein
MVYTLEDKMRLSPVKIKSPYYVGKKKLMRASESAIDKMYGNPKEYANLLPSQWFDSVQAITVEFPKDYWKAMDAQSRRKCIEAHEPDWYNS